jgi:hypothetical protein
MAQDATTIQSGLDQPIDVFVQLIPPPSARGRPQGSPRRDCRQGPADQVATVEQTQVRAASPDRPAAGGGDHGRDHSDDTGAVSKSVQTELDSPPRPCLPGWHDRRAGRLASSRARRSAVCSPRWARILLVYVMMVLTFNSLITLFIILFTLLLATIGPSRRSCDRRPISVSALIGFLMLIGTSHQCHRPARPGRAAAHRGLLHPRRPDRAPGRVSDPSHDRDRDDPGSSSRWPPHNQGSIIAAELDGRHRRPVQRDVLTLLVIPVVYSLVDGSSASRTSARWRRAPDARPEATVTA